MATDQPGKQPAAGKKHVNTRDRRPPEVLRKGLPAPADEVGPKRAARSGPPRPGASRADASRSDAARPDVARSTVRLGGPRNEWGTRIARRVTCGRCGAEDHVPYVPRDASRALCRACATEVLKAYEVGVKVRTETRPVTCNLCGTPFQLPVNVVDDGDLLCPNCLRGFATWSGSIDTPFSERENRVLLERRTGVVVRTRRSDDDG